MSDKSRREHRQLRKTRRRILLGLLGLVALGGGLAGGILSDQAKQNAIDPSPSPSATQVLVPLDVTLLMVQSTFDGQPVLSTSPLLITKPISGLSGETSVLLADPGLRVVGPAQDAPLREHAAAFGPEGLAGALRNELGLRVDSSVVVSESDLARFLKTFGPISVNVPHSIVEDGETIYEVGDHLMSATELVTFLVFPFDDPSIDTLIRDDLRAKAWQAIANLPRMASKAESSNLAVPAKNALVSVSFASRFSPLATADTSRGPVLDEIGYARQAAEFEGAWLGDVDPSDRPRVELQGRSIVEAMLLLIADGFRVDSVRSHRQDQTEVETKDEVLGARIAELLGKGTVIEPSEPLSGGLAARITIGVRA